MVNRSKAKGTRYESSEVRWWISRGFRAVRRVLHGRADQGDVGVVINGVPVTIECKACSRWELRKWMKETLAEARNAGDSVGMLSLKIQGVGDASFGENWVLLTHEGLVRIANGRAVQGGDAVDGLGREVL